MANLRDLMSDEEWQQATNTQKSDEAVVSPLLLQIAKFGYYYGWEAIEAVKRGYVQKGNKQINLELDEVTVLVEAAEKNYAQHIIDIGKAVRAGVVSSMSKHPKKDFEAALESFIKRAKS